MRNLAYHAMAAAMLAVLTTGCIIQEPADPQAELFRAAGIVLTGEARVDTALDLRRNWVRGCETRIGNLTADAFASSGSADIGLGPGGNIRDDRGITVLNSGVVTAQDLLQVYPFNGKIYLVEMTAYRLKQALEGGVSKLGTALSAAGTDDQDADGRQHGDCYYLGQSGSGRFLHVSSRLKIAIAPANQAQTISGSVNDSTLVVAAEGRRIARILIDDIAIYSNPAGNLNSGWAGGLNSCAPGAGFHLGTSFSGSAACNLYRVAIPDFQAIGNDDHPTFNPALAEVGNDGSVRTLSTDTGTDFDVVLQYLQGLAAASLTVKPAVEDRITFQ